jgi:hypothetical protein
MSQPLFQNVGGNVLGGAMTGGLLANMFGGGTSAQMGDEKMGSILNLMKPGALSFG